jgi:hypothetical protein
MQMKTSTRFLDVLFMNLPITAALCTVAELLAMAHGQLDRFSWSMFGVNFIVAYIFAGIVGMSIPCVKWGLAFAEKCKAEPGSFRFGALVNLPVNTVYSVLLCFIMSVFNVCVLGKGPFIGALIGFLMDIVPIWIACYIVSMLFAQPAEKLARRCTSDGQEVA